MTSSHVDGREATEPKPRPISEEQKAALLAFADDFADLCAELFIATLLAEAESTNGSQK